MRRRKLRPIAGPECLLKFIESVIIDEARPALLPTLEPFQLGCGTPDGCPIVVTMVQSWLKEAKDTGGEVNGRLEDPC